VQEAGDMQKHLQPRSEILNRVADRLYDRWTEGLQR
jgi:hypothetical protein